MSQHGEDVREGGIGGDINRTTMRVEELREGEGVVLVP